MYVEAEDPHVLSITEVKDQDAHRTFEREAEWAFLRTRYPVFEYLSFDEQTLFASDADTNSSRLLAASVLEQSSSDRLKAETSC